MNLILVPQIPKENSLKYLKKLTSTNLISVLGLRSVLKNIILFSQILYLGTKTVFFRI